MLHYRRAKIITFIIIQPLFVAELIETLTVCFLVSLEVHLYNIFGRRFDRKPQTQHLGKRGEVFAVVL